MRFGRDFFRVFNFAIQLIRLVIKVFGDDEDRQQVDESAERTASANADEAC